MLFGHSIFVILTLYILVSTKMPLDSLFELFIYFLVDRKTVIIFIEVYSTG